MASVIGWDIGGANTKAAFINAKNGKVTNVRTATRYFPIWKNPEKLSAVLKDLKEEVTGLKDVDCVAVTMTAELSDAFRTKREGVQNVLEQVARVFPSAQLLVLDVDAQLKSLTEALADPLRIAAANWAATGWLVSQLLSNCVVVDVGSTTTSIIPIVNGTVSALGKTDLEKLVNGELVYTGSLRTNVAVIVNTVPTRLGLARASSELFAQSGDVHLILGNIKSEDYTVETADRKGKTRSEALARLARFICADTEMLSEEEIVQIAGYIHRKQVEQVAEGLRQVSGRLESMNQRKFSIVVAGMGRNFLARKAAEQAGFNEIIDLGELCGNDVAKVTAAVGVALMAASKLEGRTMHWTR